MTVRRAIRPVDGRRMGWSFEKAGKESRSGGKKFFFLRPKMPIMTVGKIRNGIK